MLPFTFGAEKFAQLSRSLKILWIWCSPKFRFLCMSLLTTLIVENSHLWARMRSSHPKVFLGKGVLKICCIFSEQLFIRTPLDGCFCRIHFTFVKKRSIPTWKAFNTKFRLQWKVRESSYQVRKISTLFCKLVAPVLNWNFINDPSATKMSNKSYL